MLRVCTGKKVKDLSKESEIITTYETRGADTSVRTAAREYMLVVEFSQLTSTSRFIETRCVISLAMWIDRSMVSKTHLIK